MSITKRLPDRNKEIELVYNARMSRVDMDKIIDVYTPLVSIIAKQWSRRTVLPVDDLKQEGLLGLVKAVQRFNPEFGTRFYVYAKHIVIGEMRNAIRKDSKHTYRSISMTSLHEDSPELSNLIAEPHEVIAEHETISSFINSVDLYTIMTEREIELLRTKYSLEL